MRAPEPLGQTFGEERDPTHEAGQAVEVVPHIQKRVGRPIPTTLLTAHHELANHAFLEKVGYLIKPEYGDGLRKFFVDAGVERWTKVAAALQAAKAPLDGQPLRVFLLAGIGLTREQIAKELGIDSQTVKSHASIALAWHHCHGGRGRTLEEATEELAGRMGSVPASHPPRGESARRFGTKGDEALPTAASLERETLDERRERVVREFCLEKGLTKRHAEILVLRLKRESTEEIAKARGISEVTVRRHEGEICRRLLVDSLRSTLACLDAKVAADGLRVR